MKVRLGTLRLFIREVVLVDEMNQVDDRMIGDGADDDISDHLKDGEDGQSLGNSPDETMREHDDLSRELQLYFLQEDVEQQNSDAEPADGTSEPPGNGGEAESGGSAPAGAAGFYTPFDKERDHSATWYRSPGQAAGTAGDPFRSEDPHAQLGFHPPGSDGESKPLAPPIWQLSAGSDTSKVLGANAKAGAGGGQSGDGSKESEAPGGTGAEEGDEAEGEEPSTGNTKRS